MKLLQDFQLSVKLPTLFRAMFGIFLYITKHIFIPQFLAESLKIVGKNLFGKHWISLCLHERFVSELCLLKFNMLLLIVILRE